jgi:hypothetical protein
MEIYITGSPYSTIRTGDYDYLKKFKETYNKEKILGRMEEIKSGKGIKELYDREFLKSIHNERLFKEAYERVRKNKIRKEEIRRIKEEVKSKILIIEYRAPETGCLFYPEDIEELRRERVKVIIVCHEYYINILRRYLKRMTLEVIRRADKTYFFNRIDYEEAERGGYKGDYSYTRVMPLIEMKKNKIKDTLEREENILFFGLIRPNKGFINALLLSKILEREGDKRKVIIAGKCEYCNIIIRKWLLKLEIDVIDEEMRVKEKYAKNLEIYYNPGDELLLKIVNRCQYGYKSDGKGFSNNASSLINIVSLGCILFTKWTRFTPKILIEEGSKYKGAIIFQEKESKDILTNKVPEPENVYKRIKELKRREKEEIIEKMRELIEEVYNKKGIIRRFFYDLKPKGQTSQEWFSTKSAAVKKDFTSP